MTAQRGAATLAFGEGVVLAVLVVLAVFVGASRVYPRVNYPSDVIGGWALGAAALGAATAAGLAVARVRNNRRRA